MVYVSYIVETEAVNANNQKKYLPLALTLSCVEIAVHVVEVYVITCFVRVVSVSVRGVGAHR